MCLGPQFCLLPQNSSLRQFEFFKKKECLNDLLNPDLRYLPMKYFVFVDFDLTLTPVLINSGWSAGSGLLSVFVFFKLLGSGSLPDGLFSNRKFLLLLDLS